jgi:hypothetical protein
MAKLRKGVNPIKDAAVLDKQDLLDFQKEFRKADVAGNGYQKLMTRLYEMATSRAVDDSVSLKAIEIVLAYTLGKPKDRESELTDQNITVEHNVISMDQVKKLK